MNYLDFLAAIEGGVAAVDLSAAGDLAPAGEDVRSALERCTALVRTADSELRPWLASREPALVAGVRATVNAEHPRRPGEPYDLWRWRLDGQVAHATAEALRLAVYDRAAPFRTPGVTAAFSVLDRHAAFDAAIAAHAPGVERDAAEVASAAFADIERQLRLEATASDAPSVGVVVPGRATVNPLWCAMALLPR